MGAGNSSAIPDLPWLAWRNSQVNFMEPPGTYYSKHYAREGRYLIRVPFRTFPVRKSLESAELAAEEY